MKGRRKLAAIMFTDIVGYSSLSHKNEGVALQIVQEHRQILRPIFAKYSGHEIKTIGDAFFVEFLSASDALNCAIEAQELLHERNRTSPKKQKILVRVGIHLSEVLETEETTYDLYGNGVNIAARLQFLAPPGGICFSEQVYDQVRGQIRYRVQKHGKKSLKNIDKPVQVYTIDLAPPKGHDYTPWLKRGASLTLALALAFFGLQTYRWNRSVNVSGENTFYSGEVSKASLGDQRIAVLPFTNLSEHPDDEYLANGIMEELISKLSNLQGFRVLARTSVMVFKDSKKPLKEIGQELKVETVLQGSVRRMGPTLKVSVQLANARTSENIWSENFDGRVDDMFQIESAIATKISSHFRNHRQVAGSPVRDFNGPIPNQEAYLTYLKGRYLMSRRTEESINTAIGFFKEAIKKDPQYAPFYVGVTNSYHLLAFYGYLSPKEALKLELPFTERALSLDPNSPEALTARACRRIYYDRDWKGAEADFKKAIDLKPSDVMTHHYYGEFLIAMKRTSEAETEFQTALELDPLSPVIHAAYGLPKFFNQQFDKSAAHFKSVVTMDPGYIPAYYWLGTSYLRQGSYKAAVEALEKASDLSDQSPLITGALAFTHAVAGQKKKAEGTLAELHKKSLKRYVSSYYFARIYAALGNKEQSLKYLDKAYDENAINLVYLNVDPAFDEFKNDTRFVALKKKAGF